MNAHPASPRLGLVAGEASGDLLAGLLLDGLRARWPGLQAAGIGGAQMAARGFEAWWPVEKLSVRGYLEVLPRLPELLAEHGIGATYVGHPLASVIPLKPDRAAARRALGLAEQGTVVALLPGSRAAEVKHLGARFFQAAALIQKAQPATQFIVPAVPHLQPQIEAAARASGLGDAVKVLRGQSHAALAACDVTLIASGTATLEAALFKRPMVIAYAMPGFSYRLMAAKRQLPWIGLPNVLCAPRGWLHRPASVAPHDWADRPGAPFVVPELIQHAATPDALARAVLDWLAAPEKIAAVQQRFTALHHELQRDTAQLATDAIETLLAR